MPLYSEEELKQMPEFKDLEKALRKPEEVIRLNIDRVKDAAALARVAELENVQELVISLSDVSGLLPRLANLKDLQELHLQACLIPAFPGSILGLRHLRSLSIGNCSLRELPEDLSGLASLDALYLSQNKLVKVPKSIGHLSRLKCLALGYNEIEILPDAIGDLTQLKFLSAGPNRLTSLPETIRNLTSLEGLHLSHNKLTGLPESVCDLPRLESLSLEHNPFESLPRGLSEMNLKDLAIEADRRHLFMDWRYPHSQKPPRIELADMRLLVTPDSELHAPLVSTIQACQLAELESVILATAREAVEIKTTVPEDYSQRGTSRFGGFPDLVDAGMFPKTDGLYWCFLAQINLAEMAHLNGFLPRTGLLAFFVESTERLNGRVVFYEGEFEKLMTMRHGGEDQMVDGQDDYSGRPHRVEFSRRFSNPHRRVDRPWGIDDILGYKQWEPLREGVSHQINGYTYTQHETPQELAAKKLGGQRDEWVPLLQLGWDSKVGFCFWDAGTITFVIHQEDLRRADFSRVHVNLESS